MTYRLIEETKNGFLIYENIKTKCKKCFNKSDFEELKDLRKNKSKYE